jgi:hypothetical protein
MAKIDQIANGMVGLVARQRINQAIRNVETDSTIGGSGIVGSPLSITASLATKQNALGFTPENAANKNQLSGYAGLDATGKINPLQLPDLQITNPPSVLSSEAAMLALDAAVGDVVIRTDASITLILAALPASDLANWVQLLFPTAGGVHSVFGRIGSVSAQANDYAWNQIDKGVSSIADIATKSHGLLDDTGVYTHEQIDTHLLNLDNPHEVTAAQIGAALLDDFNTHDSNTTIHFVIDDITPALNKVFSSEHVVNLLAEKSDSSALDSHVENESIHFSIDDTVASSSSVYSSDKIESLKVASNEALALHVNDTAIHFVIDDSSALANVVFSGLKITNELALKADLTTLTSHANDATIHFVINDATPLLNAVFSSQKVTDELALKASDSALTSHVNDATIHYVINDTTPALNTAFSGQKIVDSLALKADSSALTSHTNDATIHFVINDSTAALATAYSSQKIVDTFQALAQKNQANGYAGLDANSKILLSQIPEQPNLKNDAFYWSGL